MRPLSAVARRGIFRRQVFAFETKALVEHSGVIGGSLGRVIPRRFDHDAVCFDGLGALFGALEGCECGRRVLGAQVRGSAGDAFVDLAVVLRQGVQPRSRVRKVRVHPVLVVLLGRLDVFELLLEVAALLTARRHAPSGEEADEQACGGSCDGNENQFLHTGVHGQYPQSDNGPASIALAAEAA